MKTNTIKEAIERINNGEKTNIAIKEFIDGFFLNQDPDFQASLIQEEFELAEIENHKLISISTVAVVEQVADIAGIPAPDWCKKPYYYFDEPFFTTKNKELQNIYFDEAPIFCRNRNLFCNRLISVFHTKKKKS